VKRSLIALMPVWLLAVFGCSVQVKTSSTVQPYSYGKA
jgi:hypothetical protein